MPLLSQSSLHVIPWLAAGLLAVAGPVLAEDAARNRVVPMENVRVDYARVMHVEPVYQTLRASRMEERCESVPEPDGGKAQAQPGRLARMFESVQGLFSPHAGESRPAQEPAAARRNCRMVEVGREFRRPIAYDVDYVYRGAKYRSRLPEDPGNRLRIRVSVTPEMPLAAAAAER